MSTRIASPITASAAATVIDMSANSCPSRFCSCRENATSVRFAALSMSSMQMRITSGLRRMSTPMVPRMKRIAARSRNQDVSSVEPPASNPPITGSPRNHGEPLRGSSDFVGLSSVVTWFTAEIDRADGGDEKKDRGQLEGIEIFGKQLDPDGLDRAEDAEVGLLRLSVRDPLQH